MPGRPRSPLAEARSRAARRDRGRRRRRAISRCVSLLREISGLRDGEVYRRTAVGRAVDADLAALRLHDGPADRQPEAEPARFAAHRPRTEEALEEARELVGWDRRAVVVDGDLHEPGVRFGAQLDLGSFRAVLAGV